MYVCSDMMPHDADNCRQLLGLEVSPDSTVREVKKKICCGRHIHPSDFYLTYQCKPMSDDKLVSDYLGVVVKVRSLPVCVGFLCFRID